MIDINKSKMPLELQKISENLKQYLPEIKELYQIKRIGIFGSYVRGEETENSDLDILIEFSSDARFGLLTFCQLEDNLSQRLGKKVDLVMKNSLKPNIGKYILQEVIYL